LCFVIHHSFSFCSTLSLHDALPIFLAPFVEPSIYSAPSNSHPQSQSYTQWPTSSQVWERREGDFATSRGRWDQSQMSHPGSYIKDRKSTRLNSSHVSISYAVFCLKK